MNKKTKRWKLDILRSMFVTRAVSHFEMSALNTRAPLNAVGVYVNMSMQLMLNPKKKKRNSKLLVNSWNKQLNKKTKRWKLDVLFSISVTLAVAHFEMSTLNAVA